jgi:hypothetical protein
MRDIRWPVVWLPANAGVLIFRRALKISAAILAVVASASAIVAFAEYFQLSQI